MLPWLVRLAIAAIWAGVAALVWTALRDVRDEARRERGPGPHSRQ